MPSLFKAGLEWCYGMSGAVVTIPPATCL